MIPKRVLAFTVLANIGFWVQAQAHAQVPCPEVLRLRSAATETWKQAMRAPTSEHCRAFDDASSAAKTTFNYAMNNRESCAISPQLLSEVEQIHRQMEQTRDNACAGRPLRPYPAEVVQH